MAFYPPVSGYDFHIYYHNKAAPVRDEAIRLKNAIFDTFQQEIDEDVLVVKVLRDEQIRGPHITAFFEVDVNSPELFVQFFSWIQLNHGPLSVLIHPNSDDTLKDHTIHAAWLGDKLPLLLYQLEGVKFYDPNFGFPSRDLINNGFYEDPELYSKSIMVRLLNKGPLDQFY